MTKTEIFCILYFSLQVGTAFAVTNWQFVHLALHLQRQIENLTN